MPGIDQPNLYLFEVVMITDVPMSEPLVRTIGVHPLVVVPRTIRASDRARGRVDETGSDFLATVAGRGGRVHAMEGTFGVESRGLGIYIGTGDHRFRRFYHEVVRLSEALDQEDVDDAKDFFRSPLLGPMLATYDPERCTFAINFYNLWDQFEYTCRIGDFSWTRSAMRGSAVGYIEYSMQVREAGPIVTSKIGALLLGPLFDALSAWNNVNALAASYTLDVIVESLFALSDVVIGNFNDSLAAWKAQKDGVAAVLGGFQEPGKGWSPTDEAPDPSARSSSDRAAPNDDDDAASRGREQDGFSAYIGDALSLAALAQELADGVSRSFADDALARGAVDWSGADGEGGIPRLDALDAAARLYRVQYAAEYQRAAGVLFGMDRESYARLLESTGKDTRDTRIKGAVTHVVIASDTATSIERLYGVEWEQVLRLNRLLPDEALLVGARLQIPRLRSAGQQSRIDGLPVFGSHVGQAAWGTDIDVSYRANADGDVTILRGVDVLVQGARWLVAQFAAPLLLLVKELPDDAIAPVLRAQLGRIYLSDKRFVGTQKIDVTTDENGMVSVTSVLTAIGGATITAGG